MSPDHDTDTDPGAGIAADDAGAPWQPVTETVEDLVPAGAALALHGLLDAPGPAPGREDPLPPLWHWLAFLPRVAQHDLGADGHPRVGTFLPPVGLGRRRMYAGGQLRFDGPLPVGAAVRRESVVASVEEKTGRTGSLVFVTVRHELVAADGRGPGGVVEHQDLVYRAMPAPAPEPTTPASTGPAATGPAASPPDPEAEEEWTWTWSLTPDPTLLFRFSALTYNAHRIHYDRTYATTVEAYPGLVVHGPLQAIALAELCRRFVPDRRLTSFRFRALRPAFDGHEVRFCGRAALAEGEDQPDGGEGSEGEGRIDLAAIDHEGHVTMRASAGLAANAGS
jgi:3-methylfumaryl-CoA hydratase